MNTVDAARAEVDCLTPARLFGDCFLSFFGDRSRFLCLLRLRPCCLSVLLLSVWVEELSFLDMRASSPFMYFSALASTSAMLACGFLDMENIKSFYCTPNPAMNAVIANFSFGASTFRDLTLDLWTYDLRLSCGLCSMVSR